VSLDVVRCSIPEPDGTGILTLDLEAVAPPPNLPIRVGVFLSQALAPLQGFTAGSLRAPAPAAGLLPKRGHARAFRGYGPLSRVPSLGERHRIAAPTPRCSRARDREVTRTAVAPTGFRTLSTHCSPPNLPSLFHPGPAFGVHPSRLCSAMSAVRASRPTRTLLRFLTLCQWP
jgi:hypothetical protein